MKEEEEKGEPMEDVNIDLNFIDPNESYFHAVRYFLINLLDGETFNVGDLTDIIITQIQVGTLVVNEDDTPEDKNLLAFATLLPFALHSKRDSIKSVVNYCTAKATEKLSAGDSKKFQDLLSSKKIALLVNERLVNLPPDPVPALHKALKDDRAWALEQGNTAFNINYILYITKVAEEIPESGPSLKRHTDEDLIYYKFEDEMLQEEAEYKILFNSKVGLQMAGATNPTEYTMKSNLQYKKMILLIPFKKYMNCIDKFTNLLSA
jgi:protein BCP1